MLGNETDVAARIARQSILTRDDPADFYCVLDESTIRRDVGGAHIMYEQLQCLAETGWGRKHRRPDRALAQRIAAYAARLR